MGKYVHVRRPEDRQVDRLKNEVYHALGRGDIDPVVAALIERGVAHVRACLHSPGRRPAPEVDIACRGDTLIHVLIACKRRLDQAFEGTDLDVGLVPSKPEEEVWEAMRARLLRTQPEVVRRRTHNLYRYHMSVRPGERLQPVPGLGCTVEEYLNSKAFTDALSERIPKNRTAKPIALQVHVGGKYMSELDLDRVYGEDPSEKRSAAEALSGEGWEPLAPEVLSGLLSGDFEMVGVEGKSPQELFRLISTLRADPTKTVVLNSAPNRLDLDSLSLRIPGRFYGWTPATEAEAAKAASAGAKLLLACKVRAGRGRNDIERIKTVLLFDKSASPSPDSSTRLR